LQRLQSEGANTPADLLLTSDAGRLAAAQKTGVLQAVKSDTLNKNIPAAYRDPAGYWYGLSVRARPILYAKAGSSPSNCPPTKRWPGRNGAANSACAPPTASTTSRWWRG
jgi:iron(III) transport system substrate-binding protein